MNLAMLLDIPSMIVPDDVALRSDDDTVTYAELRSRVGRVAAALRSSGIGPGDRVAILATNRVAAVEVIFGAAAVGAVAVPMNFRARPNEVEHLLRDSGAKLVVAEARYEEVLRAACPTEGPEAVFIGPDFDRWRSAPEEAAEIHDVDDGALAVLLYTSGTTSLPKGVMLTHGGLTSYVMGLVDSADGTDKGRTLLVAPLYHVAGTTSLLSSLYGGRSVVLLPQFDAGEWLATVERERITNAFVVPTMLARIVDEPSLRDRDLQSLEMVTYGAAPMPPAVIRRAIEAFPDTVGFSGAYGQTETTSTVAVLTVEDHRLVGTDEEVGAKLHRLASVGRLVDDVEARVVSESGEVLPPNAVGEVQLRTARSMAGYWGSGSERTRDTIDDQGWIHTGDLGQVDEDGYLFLGGRAGDLIIRGGENVSPAEVETVLYEHPDVLEAGVVGIPDEEWGERIAAAVVLRGESAMDEKDMLAWCAERLGGSKRPDSIAFLSQLPRTSTGKLLRRDLPSLLLHG
ncbi:AMP-binding protein [Acidimicrobiia bacterium EGI L10123]|uniref:class I adenylate-forming enzyme family protein n=1 Tax=Salinilacustrithrix flava TaxID=2957203 RepID=UPI003D7C1A0E|nr:AMP-binding protein [Acidimicrobiia bacterium EGI L10123]